MNQSFNHLHPVPQPGDRLPPTPPDDIDLFPRIIAPGRVVLLTDGRIGIIDVVCPSPCCDSNGVERAYVIGAQNEFADWVLFGEIAHIYGVAAATVRTSSAAATA